MSHWGAITAHLSTQQATEGLRDDVLMCRHNIVDQGENISRLQPRLRGEDGKSCRLKVCGIQMDANVGFNNGE